MSKLKHFKDPNVKSFLIRLGIFLGIYVVVGLFHSTFITYLYRYKFGENDVYMKYMIFPVFLLFVVLNWGKIKKIKKYSNDLLQTILFTILSVGSFLIPADKMIVDLKINLMISHFLPLFLGFVFAFLAIFNLRFVKHFLKAIIVIALLAICYTVMQILVENYWMYLSGIVVYALKLILPPFFPTITINTATFGVGLHGFDVSIGPPCAGLYSLVTFTGLYLVALLFAQETRSIKYGKALLALLAGMVTVFILNILRVAIIVIVGAFFSKDLAINLFHEYLSAIFLIALFLFYLYKVIPKVTEER